MAPAALGRLNRPGCPKDADAPGPLVDLATTRQHGKAFRDRAVRLYPDRLAQEGGSKENARCQVGAVPAWIRRPCATRHARAHRRPRATLAVPGKRRLTLPIGDQVELTAPATHPSLTKDDVLYLQCREDPVARSAAAGNPNRQGQDYAALDVDVGGPAGGGRQP